MKILDSEEKPYNIGSSADFFFTVINHQSHMIAGFIRYYQCVMHRAISPGRSHSRESPVVAGAHLIWMQSPYMKKWIAHVTAIQKINQVMDSMLNQHGIEIKQSRPCLTYQSKLKLVPGKLQGQ